PLHHGVGQPPAERSIREDVLLCCGQGCRPAAGSRVRPPVRPGGGGPLMSFRLFIYYCAICGGWAALAGWALGRTLAPSGGVEESAIKGLFLGLAVALGVGLVDALAVASLRRPSEVLARVLLAVAVGCLGGWLGGTVGEHFHSQMTDS